MPDKGALTASCLAYDRGWGGVLVRLRTALEITSAIIVVKAFLVGIVMYERAAILGY